MFKLRFLSFLCLFFTTFSVFALEEEFSESQSFTCSTHVDRVILHEHGVALLVDDSWFGADGLQVSSEGVFLLENGSWISLDDAIKCGDNYYTWKCPKCKTWNPQGVSRCSGCGKSRYG